MVNTQLTALAAPPLARGLGDITLWRSCPAQWPEQEFWGSLPVPPAPTLPLVLLCLGLHGTREGSDIIFTMTQVYFPTAQVGNIQHSLLTKIRSDHWRPTKQCLLQYAILHFSTILMRVAGKQAS